MYNPIPPTVASEAPPTVAAVLGVSLLVLLIIALAARHRVQKRTEVHRRAEAEIRAERERLESELLAARAAISDAETERTALHSALAASQAASESLQSTLQQLTTDVYDRLLLQQSNAFAQTTAALEQRAAAEITALRTVLDSAADERVSAHLAPVADAIGRVEQMLEATHARQATGGARVETVLQTLADEQRRHWQDTRQLASAFRSAQLRGTFGEFALIRALEHAGLRRGVHFEDQPTDRDDAGAFRPDVLVRLPDGRAVAVDSKTPLEHLLGAYSIDDAVEQRRLLQLHARSVRRHIDQLAQRAYPARLQASARATKGATVWAGVLMFVPSEEALDRALQEEPGLLRAAAEQGIYLVSPTTLLVVLNCIDSLWRHDQLDRRAAEIVAAGTELYDRLATVVRSIETLGTSIGKSVTAYNALVGSVQSRLAPSARQLRAVGAARDSAPLRVQALTDDPRTFSARVREQLDPSNEQPDSEMTADRTPAAANAAERSAA